MISTTASKYPKYILALVVALFLTDCGGQNSGIPNSATVSGTTTPQLCPGNRSQNSVLNSGGWGGGDGTEGNPYLICTNEQFKAI